MSTLIFDRRAWYKKIYRAIRRKGTLPFRESLMPHGERSTMHYLKVRKESPGKKEMQRIHRQEIKWIQLANSMIPDNGSAKELANHLVDLLERREDLRVMMADFLEGKYE